MSWNKVKIGSFLKERAGRYKPAEANKMGLKRVEKIDFSGTYHLVEKTTNTDMILVKRGDLLISGINAEKGAVTVYDEKDDALATIHYSSYEFDKKKIDVEYFRWFLISDAFKNLLKENAGSGIKTELKAKHLLPLEVYLPELEKQKEIVLNVRQKHKKISDVQSLVEEQKASLQQLRQAILQEAVQGKLTKQSKDDEPVEKLLQRIKAEKQKLVKEKKTKWEFPLHAKSRELPVCELPASWTWARFWDIAWCYRGHNPPKSEFIDYPKEGYIRFVQITDFKTDDRAVYVPKSKGLKYVQKGEIIMAAYRHIGKLSRTMEGAFNVALCKIINIEPYSRDFLELVIKSDFVTGELLAASERGHIPSMHSEHLLSLWVPVPPLSEQQRIVAKVEQLMQMVNELEQQVQQSQAQAGQLLQVVLKEAFGGKAKEYKINNAVTMAAEH